MRKLYSETNLRALILVLSFFFNFCVFARQISASGSGNWSNTAIWGNLTPGPGDNITIPAGFTVTVDVAATVSSIQIVDACFSAVLLIFNSNIVLTVTGNVDVGAAGGKLGTITLSGGYLKVGGNLTINGGSSNLSLGTVEFNGSSNKSQTIPAGNYNNLILNNSVGTTLGGAVTISGGNNPGALTVASGTLTTGGNLTLKSDANGTARIANSTGTISGLVTVERYIPINTTNGRSGKAWRLLTSPVSGTTINAAWQEGHYFDGTEKLSSTNATVAATAGYGVIITASGPANAAAASTNKYDFLQAYTASSIRKYSVDALGVGNWNNGIDMGNAPITVNTANSIAVGTAYMIYVRGDRTVNSTSAAAKATTLRATGNVQNSNYTVTVKAPSTQKFTLVANPYPSPIDMELIFSRIGTTIMQQRFWLWDANLNSIGGYRLVERQSAGNYTTTPYDFSGGAGSPVGTTDYRYIQSGTAFFVQPVVTNTADQTFVIQQSDKVSNRPANGVFRIANSQLNNTTQTQNLYINLNVGNPDNHYLADGVTVRIGKDYSAGQGSEDIEKPANMSEALAVNTDGNLNMVDGRPEAKNDIIQLNLTGVGTKNYQLQVKADNFNNAYVAYLEDKFTKQRIVLDMSGGITTYDFVVTTDASSKAADRFRIVMASAPGHLPDHLTLIKALQKDKGINVQWQVNTDEATVRYQVERSTDGVNFSGIASIPSKASATEAAYQLQDDQAVTGSNYYRIQAYDAFGKSSYSTIAKGVIGTGSLKFVVYPNPVKSSTFSLQFPDMPSGNYYIRLFNNYGQLIHQQNLQHEGGWLSQSVSIPNQLAPGMYNVEVRAATGNKFNQQLIKQ